MMYDMHALEMTKASLQKNHWYVIRAYRTQKEKKYAVYVDRTHDLQIFSLTLSASEG